MSNRRVWARRLAMPLAILVAAGGLALWTTHRRQVQAAEVGDFVTGLCDDLAAGRDPSPHLQGTDSLMAGPLLARLRSVITDADGAADLIVVAEPGDTTDVGIVGQDATHTAMILVEGRAVLGLRVHHPGAREDIAIIGFWVPRPP